MTSWLAISLGLWLGQTPQITPTVPPDPEVQDPAAIELREAWERALDYSAVTDEGGEGETDEILLPPRGISTPDSPIIAPLPGSAPLDEREALEAPGIGGAGVDTAPEATAAEAPAPQAAAAPSPAQPAGDTQGEMEQLRAQLQALQAQLEALQQESAAAIENLQQQHVLLEQRAQALQRLREQRLDLLEFASIWVLAADQALAVGELDIDDALERAATALADAIQNAAAAGQGPTVVILENALTRLAFVDEAVDRRDVYDARWALYTASLEIRQAHQNALERPGATIVIP